MLKLAKRYHIDVLQAITWNYSVAIALTWFFFKPQFQLQQLHHKEIIVEGILLPVLFLIISAAVRITGIVKTDIAQRLSLLVPILAAFFYFGEPLTYVKMIGISVGIVAILFAIPARETGRSKNSGGLGWLYLLLVFAGFGVIDFLFKQIALFKDVPYTTSLFICFIIAFIVSVIFLIVQIARRKTKFSFPHILIGWALGVVNFGNILFYLKAHKALANQPSTVFISMNVGVILLGALVGLMIFKEKLSTLNVIGLAMALASVVIITAL